MSNAASFLVYLVWPSPPCYSTFEQIMTLCLVTCCFQLPLNDTDRVEHHSWKLGTGRIHGNTWDGASPLSRQLWFPAERTKPIFYSQADLVLDGLWLKFYFMLLLYVDLGLCRGSQDCTCQIQPRYFSSHLLIFNGSRLSTEQGLKSQLHWPYMLIPHLNTSWDISKKLCIPYLWPATEHL